MQFLSYSKKSSIICTMHRHQLCIEGQKYNFFLYNLPRTRPYVATAFSEINFVELLTKTALLIFYMVLSKTILPENSNRTSNINNEYYFENS